MKLLIGTLILGTSAVAFGQDVVTTAPVSPVAPRAAILPAISSDIAIIGSKKNLPFSADESGETVRILPDGNRVVESWTGHIARNSEGKIRRDITSGKVGDGASRPMIVGAGAPLPVAIGSGALALGTTVGNEYRIATELNAANAVVVARGTGEARTITLPRSDSEGSNNVYIVRTDIENGVKAGTWVSADAASRAAAEADIAAAGVAPTRVNGKFHSRSESLGTRDFGGIQAEGTRVTMTFAAGSIGNDKDIEVVSESWVSKELGVIVYSKRTDPRFGETTYQMTNINRAEPDASLFPGR